MRIYFSLDIAHFPGDFTNYFDKFYVIIESKSQSALKIHHYYCQKSMLSCKSFKQQNMEPEHPDRSN